MSAIDKTSPEWKAIKHERWKVWYAKGGKASRLRRWQNPEYVAYARKWARLQYYRLKDDPEFKKRRAEASQRYRSDPLLRMRHEARWQANSALISGKLKRKPCEKCGATKTEMHHPDYYKPLEVIWLCPECHRREHANERCRKRTQKPA